MSLTFKKMKIIPESTEDTLIWNLSSNPGNYESLQSEEMRVKLGRSDLIK